MATINVMSWNIENLGPSKFYAANSKVVEAQPADRCYAADYIAAVVSTYSIDLLGVMELRGGLGFDIAEMVIASLGAGWKFSVSSQQQSKRQEETIYIWKTSPNLNLWLPPQNDNTPVKSLVNTIDDDSMEPLFKTLSGAVTKESVYQALLASSYIRRDYSINYGVAYRVVTSKWSDLKNGAAVDFGSKNSLPLNPGLDANQLAILKNILLQAGIVLFPNKDERSPYLLYVNLGTAPTPKTMLFSVLHFPGPQTDVVMPAIANLCLCDPIINAQNLLIMGDFNITRERQGSGDKFDNYQLEKNSGTNQWSFTKSGKKSLPDFFSVITAPPISATDLLGNLVNTSLSPKNMAKVQREEYRVNPYDKFFFKTKNNAVTHNNSAHCVDLIEAMNLSKTLTYKSAIAECGMKFLKARYAKANVDKVIDFGKILVKRKADERKEMKVKLQKIEAQSTINGNPKNLAKRAVNQASKIKLSDAKVKKLQDDLEELKELIKLLRVASFVVPINTPASFVVYRSISDHLPISVTLTF